MLESLLSILSVILSINETTSRKDILFLQIKCNTACYQIARQNYDIIIITDVMNKKFWPNKKCMEKNYDDGF